MDNDPILEQVAQRFNVAVSQLSPLTGGNYAQVYEWVQNGQGYVLEIAPPDKDTDLQSMRSTQEWLAYLAAHDAPVVCPVYSQRGSLIEPVEHEGQTYLVSTSKKISGVRAETLPHEQWDTGLIQKLGRVIGRCHAVAQEYVPNLKRPEWDEATNCFNPQADLATAEVFVVEKRAQVLKVINALPKNRESYGLAHLDIHFANFIVDAQQGGIVLIDFDDCAYGWYALDIAMLLFDVLVVYNDQQRELLGRRFLEELLKGYRAEKALPEFWIRQLPTLLKLLEIGVYAMLAQHYNPVTCQDKWVNKFMPDRERRIREDVLYVDFLAEGN